MPTICKITLDASEYRRELEQKFLQENFMPIRETGEGLLIQQLCPDPPLHQTCSGP